MIKPKKNPVTKLIGAGVKAAAKASAKKANARGLKAANKDVGVKYKKGLNENNWSGRNETKPKQVSKTKMRGNNPDAPFTSPSSYKASKSGYNTFAKKNPEIAKATPPTKYKPRISRSEKVNKKFK